MRTAPETQPARRRQPARSRPRRGPALLVLVLTAILPTPAGAVSDEDFEAETTRSLLALCTVSAEDPRSAQAIHFCQGYLVGAFDFHVAQNSGPDGQPLVCPPDPLPSRDVAVAEFVAWTRAKPQYMGEVPVETWFRFLIETWPCEGRTAEGGK